MLLHQHREREREMHPFRPCQLETPTFPYSDLQLLVSGNENNPNLIYNESTPTSSSPPLSRVRVPSPNPQSINQTLNPNFTPQHRKRLNPDFNHSHTHPRPHKIHLFEQQQQKDEEEFEYESSENGNNEGDEDHTEEEDSCSSSFLKNENGGRKEKKRTTIDISSVKQLLETVVTQQHRFFMNLLETLEKNEQQRERIRADKEEKWRAEERAHRRIMDNAMLVLTETLLRGRNGRETVVGKFDRGRERAEKKKKRGKNWKRGEVLKLIQLRGEMKKRFSNTSRRGFVWDELAQGLVSCGIRRDGKQCREKWDKLMASYKDVIDGKKDSADLLYFSELQSVLDCSNGGIEF